MCVCVYNRKELLTCGNAARSYRKLHPLLSLQVNILKGFLLVF